MLAKESRYSVWFVIGGVICAVVVGIPALLVFAVFTWGAIFAPVLGLVIVGGIASVNYLAWGWWLPRRLAETGQDEAIARGPQTFRFSLATLFLAVTLCAVCMGAVLVSPWLALIMMAISLIAVFHCRRAIELHQRQIGRTMTPTERIITFLASWLAVSASFAVGVGTFAAFMFAGALAVWLVFDLSDVSDSTSYALWIVATAAVGGSLAFLKVNFALWPKAPGR